MAITTAFTIIFQVFLLLASGPFTLVSGPLLLNDYHQATWWWAKILLYLFIIARVSLRLQPAFLISHTWR